MSSRGQQPLAEPVKYDPLWSAASWRSRSAAPGESRPGEPDAARVPPNPFRAVSSKPSSQSAPPRCEQCASDQERDEPDTDEQDQVGTTTIGHVPGGNGCVTKNAAVGIPGNKETKTVATAAAPTVVLRICRAIVAYVLS